MAKYKITGKRFLRKYSAPSRTPTYSAHLDAEKIAANLGSIEWEEVSEREATFPVHSGKSEASDAENIETRNIYDAALFCGEHTDGKHRAFANAACYRFIIPDSTANVRLTELSVRVNSDPYNSTGARISVYVSDENTPPLDCATCRIGSSSDVSSSAQTNNGAAGSPATEWYSTNTHVEAVSPRREEGGNWFATSGQAIIRPEGGLLLKKYLYVFVLLENYAVARNGFLEGSSYVDTVFELTTTSYIGSWPTDVVVDVSTDSGVKQDELAIWNVGDGAVKAAAITYDKVYDVRVFGYEDAPSANVSNLRTAAIVAARKDSSFYIDLFTPQEATSPQHVFIESNFPKDDSSIAVSLGFIGRGPTGRMVPIILSNDTTLLFRCSYIVFSADGFVKDFSKSYDIMVDFQNGVFSTSVSGTYKGVEPGNIAFHNKAYGAFKQGRLTCDKDGRVLYLYEDTIDRCGDAMKTLDISGKISGIFECVSESVDVLSSENPTSMISVIVAGSFSAINGIPIHNFALITFPKVPRALDEITVKPLFNSTVSLDVYDDINIIPLYSATHSGFLSSAEDRSMTAFMIFGQFKKANGIDVDGCVFVTRTGTMVRPALKKINNMIGVFFENYCQSKGLSDRSEGYALFRKYFTIERL